MNKVEAFIRESYADIIPDGAPLPFVSMDYVRKSGGIYTATLTMWDGKKSTLRMVDGSLKSFSWDDWEGDDISYEDGKWVRVKREDP